MSITFVGTPNIAAGVDVVLKAYSRYLGVDLKLVKKEPEPEPEKEQLSTEDRTA